MCIYLTHARYNMCIWFMRFEKLKNWKLKKLKIWNFDIGLIRALNFECGFFSTTWHHSLVFFVISFVFSGLACVDVFSYPVYWHSTCFTHSLRCLSSVLLYIFPSDGIPYYTCSSPTLVYLTTLCYPSSINSSSLSSITLNPKISRSPFLMAPAYTPLPFDN